MRIGLNRNVRSSRGSGGAAWWRRPGPATAGPVNLLINGRGPWTEHGSNLNAAHCRANRWKVAVSVTDRGSGILRRTERIFEPFVSANPRPGLLAICRTIVTAHHGRLWATNNADRGASLHFTLCPPKTSVPAAGSAS
jgi:K+-sensing histidine kinase KdpD